MAGEKLSVQDHLRASLADAGDIIHSLEQQLADAQREAEEDEREHRVEVEAYRKTLFDAQKALDMRCTSNPELVGCEDTLFDVPQEITRQIVVARQALTNALELIDELRGYQPSWTEIKYGGGWNDERAAIAAAAERLRESKP